jgi:D-3-phosphoglycerate dehydrogenase
MRMLVVDKLHLEPLEELEVLGVQIVARPDVAPDDLPKLLRELDADILVVRSTRVTAAMIEAAPGLSLIVRAGAGVNTIDVEAASRRGVYVANCPGRNAAAVAELTMAFLLALDRRLVDATLALREGRWEKASFQDAGGIYGKTLGVAGVGAIGRLVIERARGFGMQVCAWSRSLSAARAAKLRVDACASLEALAKKSDALTIHLPLTPQTARVVNRRVLEALPDGAIFINTARAEVVDYAALAEVAPKKGLRLGLDVFPDEPKGGSAAFVSPLALGGVGSTEAQKKGALTYATPHIGASTEQAQRATATEVSRIVRAFLTEEEVPNVVNVCRNTPARYALVLRARDQVGVLANALSVIKRHGLNIEEISNTIFEGAEAACTKLRLSGRPSENCLREIRAFEEVLHVDVVPLPNLA